MKSPETVAMSSGYPRGVQHPKDAAMMRPEAGALRLVRAASTSSGVHDSRWWGARVGGSPASTTSLAVVFLGTWAVAIALTGRRLATTQLVGLLLLGQAVTHVVSPPVAEASGGHRDARGACRGNGPQCHVAATW